MRQGKEEDKQKNVKFWTTKMGQVLRRIRDRKKKKSRGEFSISSETDAEMIHATESDFLSSEGSKRPSPHTVQWATTTLTSPLLSPQGGSTLRPPCRPSPRPPEKPKKPKRKKKRKSSLELQSDTSDNELDDLEMQVVRTKPEGLDALCSKTKFSKKELQIMYRGFKQECPTGIVNEETFKEIYAQFFPQGGEYSSAYAHYVFNTFDQDHNGTINFEEFVKGLSVLARGTVDQKLLWAFSLYDVNGDGIITKDEMLDIVTAIYDMMGKYAEPSIDEHTAKDHVERVFLRMDSNKDGVISIEEFMEICGKDELISKSMSMFDTVL